MRIVIVGGGMSGLNLSRLLRGHGFAPITLERAGAGHWAPRPFVLPFHGFAALRASGTWDAIHDAGWEVAPQAGMDPIGVTISYVRAMEIIADGVPVEFDTQVTGLVRDGDRVTAVQLRGPSGDRTVAADLVVACDGVFSGVRDMAGIDATLAPAESGHISFMSDRVVDRSFAMRYMGNGQQVGLFGWPEGSAGWWDIDRVGRDAAVAPGIDAFKRAFAHLLPAAAPALEGVTSTDQLLYREVTTVVCPRWWVPGVIVIGDAAHFLGPEAGLGSGLGLSDTLALATALAEHPDDPDAACRHYDMWHGPAVRPYEVTGLAGVRIGGGERLPEEIWPPRS